MTFSPDLAEIRFGCGLSPAIPAPQSPQAMLQGLTGPDDMVARFAIDNFDTFQDWLEATRDLRKPGGEKRKKKDRMEDFRKARTAATVTALDWSVASLLRWTHTATGFRERLVAFWADHFTAIGKIGLMRTGMAPYIETAIRPHLTGRFGDLLIAASTHPLMLHFLDQTKSVGPNSRAAKTKDALGGLNENLAREVLELHTLGVNGPYGQDDVRQLAELFTGLSYNPQTGFAFKPAFAEPGKETVMGKTYGGNPATLDAIHAALHDLAVHPATAQHIASKLAVHFVADAPDPDLVQRLAAVFLDSGGDLMATYGALLDHPAAWSEVRSNVKPPADFIASAWRALAIPQSQGERMRPRDIRRLVLEPLKVMGQPWLTPNGPDGWPEQDEAWITPQGVSARLLWAVSAPPLMLKQLPDPRDFVASTLGKYASEPVRFAARAAESRADAIGLVLAAPAFQRR